MRTTVDLNAEILRAAKKRAAQDGATLREVLERALRAYLGRVPSGRPYRLRWRTETGRLRPGVRLDDRDSLFEVMDGRS